MMVVNEEHLSLLERLEVRILFHLDNSSHNHVWAEQNSDSSNAMTLRWYKF